MIKNAINYASTLNELRWSFCLCSSSGNRRCTWRKMQFCDCAAL